MKKGCVIAIIVVLVLGAIGIGACVFLGMKFGAQMGNAGVTFAVETAIAEYRKQNPDAKVEPTNEAWVAALQGFQPAGGQQDLSQFIQNGKFVDILKKELIFSQNPDGSIKVTSPGKDGLPGTADDVDSGMFKKLQEKAEGATQK